jgi:uncharacterized protein (DUF2267 family)
MDSTKVFTQPGIEDTSFQARVSAFDRTVQKSQEWIRDMHHELAWLNPDGVYHLLRATLQSLRDQMNVDESAQFASQLPLLLRGTFYEGWNPQAKPKTSSKQEFLSAVRERLGPVGQPNFDLEAGIRVALKVTFQHISPGEARDVMCELKPSLREFIKSVESRPQTFSAT